VSSIMAVFVCLLLWEFSLSDFNFSGVRNSFVEVFNHIISSHCSLLQEVICTQYVEMVPFSIMKVSSI